MDGRDARPTNRTEPNRTDVRRPTRPTRAARPPRAAVVVVVVVWGRAPRVTSLAAVSFQTRASSGCVCIGRVGACIGGFGVYRGGCLMDEVVVMGGCVCVSRGRVGLNTVECIVMKVVLF